MTSPNKFDETKLAAFEKFVVLLYDRTYSEASVDAARMFLFTRKGRQIEAIPPTRAACCPVSAYKARNTPGWYHMGSNA